MKRFNDPIESFLESPPNWAVDGAIAFVGLCIVLTVRHFM